MGNEKAASGGLEWRLTVSDGSTEELVAESNWVNKAWMGMVRLVLGLKLRVRKFMEKIWKLGKDDPRRVFHCLKVALALTMVSLFYYLRPLYNGVGGNAMWAIMTVVVVFEYTVGATLSKGFNRGLATLLAGSLAIGVHSVACQSGDKVEPIVRGASVFLLASAATFSRFIPAVKARFDYGVSIFILTFSLVSVSGYRVDKLMELAQQRLSTIAIGGSMCMLISLLICPVWAGEDLHLLITRNMEKLAMSIDGCVTGYFDDSGNTTGKEEPRQNSQAYKCVLNSKATEESLAIFARWEPAHGLFGFRHPWKQYLKIGTALRYCAYCVEALNSSINSEIRAPEFMKNYLSDACMKLSSQCSNVLNELAATTKTMRKSPNMDFLVSEMNSAVEDLQDALKSLPQQFPPTPVEETEKEKRPPISTMTLPLMEVLPLVTIASLMTEIAARIEGVIESIEKLAVLVNFKPFKDEKPKLNQVTSKSPSEQEGDEGMKTHQEV